MHTIVDALEREHTLATAVARFNDLRVRAAMAATAEEMATDGGSSASALGNPPLAQGEALELLALGEVIVRKAGYGRQQDVRAARRAGASWSQIGASLGASKQSAWEAHQRWIDQQVERSATPGYHGGLTEEDVEDARRIAGHPEDD
jgi:hypothetical protein